LGGSSRQEIDLLFATRQFGQAAISPNGLRVAWVEQLMNADRTPTTARSIFVAGVDGTLPRKLSASDGRRPCNEGDVAWSPDGQRIVFLSDQAEPGQLQLYVANAADGNARPLGHLHGFVSNPRWSPDGRSIAVLQTAGSQAKTGAVEAAARMVGEVSQEIVEQQIVIVDAATGVARVVTDNATYVYEYDWAPDSGHLVYVAAPGDGDNNWWIARLFALDLVTGRTAELYHPTTQIAVPRWSPDGRSVAFIQGLMSDAGSTGGDVWLIPATGGKARNLTPGTDTSPAWLQWAPDSSSLLVTAWKNGGTSVSRLHPDSGQTEALWSGDESFQAGSEILSLSVAADGRQTALIRTSWAHPPEVWAGPIGQWSAVTHANASLAPRWTGAERVEWTNDGFAMQGWLLGPSKLEPGRKYPLVVSVHGGPASQLTPRWPTPGQNITLLAAKDYFVFLPNPRGSFGRGEAFTAANVRDLGGGDLRDVLSGVDAVLKSHPVDPKALGLEGWSYGGFMTMWALTQTGRFRAGFAGAGISNWQSYYGENLIDQWMIPYFGHSVYDDPLAYARCSAINFMKNVRTPVLVIVGEHDKECPAPQSFEYWHALRTQGIPVSLVVYPDEGHHFTNPAHTEDMTERSLDWFDRYLRN
jgi:dipeptidyl aminopeptidase/acylaminoacyl peptidase